MQMLAGYTVLGWLGSGTSGTVWKARDDRLDRVVAIKAVDAPSAEARAQWRSEAQVLAGLDNPHLVAVYGYAENAQGAFIVEEWVDGAPLSAVLSAAGRLSVGQGLGVIRGALLGLAHVHARGLVHGDIAPGNILLDAQGSSKLVDFGLSNFAGTPSASSGTAAYASPEAQRGQPLSAPSDVYAAAAVLAYLLRGAGAPAPVLDGVDAALRPVLARALDPDPARRYPDAGAFLTALEQGATARYGPNWWTQAGMAALVTAAPAAVLIPAAAGAGAGATLAGHGTTTPGAAFGGPPPPGAEQGLAPSHPAAFNTAGPGHLGQAPPQPLPHQPPPPYPPADSAATRRAARPRLLRPRIIAAAAVAAVAATAAVAYAATRPSHHKPKPTPIAAGPSIPGVTSLPTVPVSSAVSTAASSAASTSAAPSAGSIAGTWTGTYAGATGLRGTFTVVFTLLGGSGVSGRITIPNSCIRDGTISGTISGTDLGFGKVKSAGDVGTVSFHGTVSGNTMSGEFSSNTTCGSDRGTWQATRS